MNNVSRLCCLGVCAVLLAACSQDQPPHQSSATTIAAVTQLTPELVVTLAAPVAQRATDAAAKPAASARATTVYQLLQGKWQSTIDTLDVVEFKNHDYIDYYEQKRLGQKTFRLEKACPGAKAAEATGDNERYLVVDDVCWRIAILNDNSLELEYTDGGKILVYSKIQ